MVELMSWVISKEIIHTCHSEPGIDWSELPFAGSEVPDVEGSRQWCARRRREDRIK